MRTLLGLILVGIFLLPSTGMAEQFMMVCHLVPVPGGSLAAHDYSYIIDTGSPTDQEWKRGTVNQAPVTLDYDDGEIYFEQHDAQRRVWINRVTGKALVSDKRGPALTGYCEKATQRKF